MNNTKVVEIVAGSAQGKSMTLLLLAESFCKTNKVLYVSDEITNLGMVEKIKHLAVELNSNFMFASTLPKSLPDDINVFLLDVVDELVLEEYMARLVDSPANMVYLTKQARRNKLY